MSIRYPIPRSDALRYPFSGDRGRFWGSGWTDATGLSWSAAWDFTAASGGAVPALVGDVDLGLDSGSYSTGTPSTVDVSGLGLAANQYAEMDSANLSASGVAAVTGLSTTHIRGVYRLQSVLGEVWSVGDGTGWQIRVYTLTSPTRHVVQLLDGGSNFTQVVTNVLASEWLVVDVVVRQDGGDVRVDVRTNGDEQTVSSSGTWTGVTSSEVAVSSTTADTRWAFLGVRDSDVSASAHADALDAVGLAA